MTHTARHSAPEGPHSPAPLPPDTQGQLDAVGAAFWPITLELGYHGIFVPAGATRHRQTCPHCSPYRRKSTERCLVVQLTSPTSANIRCKHCPHFERIDA